MADAVLTSDMGIDASKRKETLNYQIRTEGFEKILLAMQHITQRIKKGEKCVATIEYDPDALFTKITTAIEQSGTEPDREKGREPFLVIVERIADKYARLVEKHLDNMHNAIAGNDLEEIREDIRMLAHVTATMQRLFQMESAEFMPKRDVLSLITISTFTIRRRGKRKVMIFFITTTIICGIGWFCYWVGVAVLVKHMMNKGYKLPSAEEIKGCGVYVCKKLFHVK